MGSILYLSTRGLYLADTDQILMIPAAVEARRKCSNAHAQ